MPKARSFQIGFRVQNGEFQIDAGAVSREVRRWPDCEGVLTIEQDEAKRSSAANRYLWGPVYDVVHDYTGQDKEDIHDEMKARFTAETVSRVDPATGEMVEFVVVRGTRRMKVSRFHKFVQDVKLFWQEFGGLTFEDEPDDMRREYQRSVAREKREKGKAA